MPERGILFKPDMPRVFIGKTGKYRIPKGTIVNVLKFYPRRKALIEWGEGEQALTMTTLLRRIKK